MDSAGEENLKRIVNIHNVTPPLLIVLAKYPQSGDVVITQTLVGLKDPDQFIIDLIGALDRYQEQANAITQPSESQLLREEQNRAYQDSLEQDRLKALQAEAAQAAIFASQLAEEKERMAVESSKQEQMALIVSAIPQEPEISEPDITQLVVRLPNGKRLERRFRQTDTLQVSLLFPQPKACPHEGPKNVRDFVLSKADETGFADSHFNLTNTFPRQVHQNMSASLKEAKLEGRALLVVETL